LPPLERAVPLGAHGEAGPSEAWREATAPRQARKKRRLTISPASLALCDARMLAIFSGAAEIQTQAIARRLLEGEK
jgi:alkylation response protein AidB-like acyl-CoA dehydrogenase